MVFHKTITVNKRRFSKSRSNSRGRSPRTPTMRPSLIKKQMLKMAETKHYDADSIMRINSNTTEFVPNF